MPMSVAELIRIARDNNYTYLDLSMERLESIPPEVWEMHSLTHLDLSCNDLTSIPPQIGKLRSLTRLDLSHNNLTSLPPQIGKLRSLTELNLLENELSSIPPQIGKLRSLTRLDLAKNRIRKVPGILKHFHLHIDSEYKPINLRHRHLPPLKIKDELLTLFTITSSIYNLPVELNQIIGDEYILQ